MDTDNGILMRNAQSSLSGKWGLAIGTFVVYLLITTVFRYIPFMGEALAIFISGPLILGLAIFSLSLSRDESADISQLFQGFDTFANALITYLLVMVFVILWTLLLIIPGIIAALSYAMTFFILADDTSIKPMEAIDRSKLMMDGYKLKLFGLCLRLFGLALLCILTLGIGFLWLFPFSYVCLAKFYDAIKGKHAITQ
jgi:uncharacterized membrane protein